MGSPAETGEGFEIVKTEDGREVVRGKGIEYQITNHSEEWSGFAIIISRDELSLSDKDMEDFEEKRKELYDRWVYKGKPE